jgi:hypothetical protein
MSTNQEVDECGTGRSARVRVDADPNRWDGFEEWKLWDDMAWNVLEGVIKKMFNVEKAQRMKLVRDAYRSTFHLMKMQSNFSEESALNAIRKEVYFRAGELRESDDRGIGIDHTEEISEEEVKEADVEVNYERIDFLADWRLLDKFVSVKESLVKVIGDAYDDSYRLLVRHNMDEDFVLFELRQMLCRQMAEVKGAQSQLRLE